MTRSIDLAGLRRDALVLSRVRGVGGRTFALLVEKLESVTRILDEFETGDPTIEGLPAAASRELRRARSREAAWAGEESVRVEAMGGRILAFGEPDYPETLHHLPDPPIALWVKGDVGALGRSAVAIVGSRRATPYGIEQAERFAYTIGASGIVVASGLARGIDARAHEGTLLAGGTTVAVLGTGLDVPYPRENQALVRRMLEHGGALVTEHPLGTPPLAGHFPRRNRILAGLAWGVLVVEASSRSGSLITARIAREIGREVFVVPGRIDSPQSRGTNELARDGAQMALEPADLLDDLPSQGRTENEPDQARERQPPFDPAETRVLESMKRGASTLDAVLADCGLPPSQALATMTSLTLRGAVEELPGARYARRGIALQC